MAIWRPNLGGRAGPKYLQIVDAIADDIRNGSLRPGARLPPQRQLAYDLNVSPNTTSRAYAEGVKRTLLAGEVGRGTFVRGRASGESDAAATDLVRPKTGEIDFAHNLPAPSAAGMRLTDTLAALSDADGLRAFTDFQTEGELAAHLEAGVEWLAAAGVPAAPEDVVIVSGAQHGILTALTAIARPGDLILTEDLTYPPVKAMAAHLGLRLAGVRRDEDGLCPEALDAICAGRVARALYLSPTLQTPTTTTMSADRRRQIAAVAERRGLTLIEDDVFGHLKPDSPPPIATVAPDRTVYVSTTSKCLAPGLRVGFLKAPTTLAPAIRRAVNLTCWMTPPLMVEIAARWIRGGVAGHLTEAQRAEARSRQKLAAVILDGHDVGADPAGYHLWLTLPPHWAPGPFQAEAQRRGVKVIDGAAFAVAPSPQPRAVRLALSHEADRDRVAEGLSRLRTLLDEPFGGGAMII